MIEQSALLEGAKFNLIMKNFINEGKDYKGLKSDLKEIIATNNLDDSKLKSGNKKFLHMCKRILQVLYNLNSASAIGGAIEVVANGIDLEPVFIVTWATAFIGSFITNRLMRLTVDSIEFETIENDTYKIVDQLE